MQGTVRLETSPGQGQASALPQVFATPQRMGGPTEFLKAAHVAAAFDTSVSSHLYSEMSLSLLASLSNAIYLEHLPWFEPLYEQRIELDSEGRAVVPQRPGWGFALSPDAVRRLTA